MNPVAWSASTGFIAFTHLSTVSLSGQQNTVDTCINAAHPHVESHVSPKRVHVDAHGMPYSDLDTHKL